MALLISEPLLTLGPPQSYTTSGLVAQPHSPVTGSPFTRQVLVTKQTRGQPYLPDQDKIPKVELSKLELGNLPNKEFKVITVKILKVIKRTLDLKRERERVG